MYADMAAVTLAAARRNADAIAATTPATTSDFSAAFVAPDEPTATHLARVCHSCHR